MKAARKMWGEIINILGAAFAPIFLCQKITKPKCNQRRAAQSTFVQKKIRP